MGVLKKNIPNKLAPVGLTFTRPFGTLYYSKNSRCPRSLEFQVRFGGIANFMRTVAERRYSLVYSTALFCRLPG